MIAHIVNGKVTNVSIPNADVNVQKVWEDAVRPTVDDLLYVDAAGVGWEVYGDGLLRPPATSDDCVWSDDLAAWQCPDADVDVLT